MPSPTEHTVRQGEDLYTIALRYGHASHRAIYDHPENAELKRRRPNPAVLQPGDVIHIPEPEEPETASLATSETHTIEIKPWKLRVFLIDSHGELLKNVDCVVQLDTGGPRDEKTDGDGLLEVKLLRRPRSATIEAQDLRWRLTVGGLSPLRDAPAEGTLGIQTRLLNLGFNLGGLDGRMGPRTRAAVQAFQERRGLKATGKLDDKTIEELEKAHGS